jgi:hypothetical protein
MNVTNSHPANKDLPNNGHNGEAKRKPLLSQEYPADKEHVNEDSYLVLEGLKET